MFNVKALVGNHVATIMAVATRRPRRTWFDGDSVQKSFVTKVPDYGDRGTLGTFKGAIKGGLRHFIPKISTGASPRRLVFPRSRKGGHRGGIFSFVLLLKGTKALAGLDHQ